MGYEQKLTLNYLKTNCLLQVVQNFCINALNGIIIQQQNVVNYLGVYIDKQLTWLIHIEHVVQKLSMARGIISKLRHYFPTTILRSVYFCLVYSHLHYGVFTCGNAAREYKINFKFKKII